MPALFLLVVPLTMIPFSKSDLKREFVFEKWMYFSFSNLRANKSKYA